MARVTTVVVLIIPAFVIVASCGQGDNLSVPTENEAIGAPDKVGAPGRRAVSQGRPISVPSDPRASYQLVRWSRLSNGNLEAVTRRDGPSGTSFSRREIDCGAMTFRYLGEGDTMEEALADSANAGAMAPLTSQSISTYVSQFVCDAAESA